MMIKYSSASAATLHILIHHKCLLAFYSYIITMYNVGNTHDECNGRCTKIIDQTNIMKELAYVKHRKRVCGIIAF